MTELRTQSTNLADTLLEVKAAMPQGAAQLVVPPLPCDILADPSLSARTYEHDDHFFAAISWGPLAPGHTIVCPRTFYPSIGDAIDEPRLWEDLTKFVSRVNGRLSETFARDVVLFEHGNASFRSPARCGTLHAHLHLIPLSNPPTGYVKNSYFHWQQASGFEDLLYMARARQEYLFYRDQSVCCVAAIDDDRPVPQQFFRRIIAESLGRHLQWDWKADPRRDVVEDSLSKLDVAVRCSAPTNASVPAPTLIHR